MTTETKCVICGEGALQVETTHRELEIDGVKQQVPSRHHWCDSCGAIQAVDDDLRFNARAVRAVTKVHRGLMTGTDVRDVRSKLCLRQEDAARLFGGGPVAFSKYENDDVIQSEAMDRLIWLVGRFPWIVAVLAERLELQLSAEALAAQDSYQQDIIRTVRTSYRKEYLVEAQMRFSSCRDAFKGFNAVTSEIRKGRVYRVHKGSRPAVRLSS